MLGSDYSARFHQLIASVAWTIEIPESWTDFFSDSGQTPSYDGDLRRHRRLKARARGVMLIERSLRTVQWPTTAAPTGIYSCDFSQRGCGLLAPFQVYPEERLRILLPTFWMTVNTARCNRIANRCYSVGTILISQHAPSLEAFAPIAPAADAVGPAGARPR